MKEKYIRYRADRKNFEIQISYVVKSTKKRIRITKTRKTLEEAIEIRDTLLASLKAGIYITGNKKLVNDTVLFKNAFATWYDTQRAVRVQGSTNTYYSAMFRNRIYPILGGIAIKDITPLLIQQYINSLVKGKEKTVSRSYAAHILKMLRAFFRYLVDEKVIERNPCQNIVIPAKPCRPKVYFTDAEIERFLKYARQTDEKTYFLFKLYFETGCRRGELLGLPWRNVDFDNERIYIQQVACSVTAKVHPDKVILKDMPKNEASIRWVNLTSDTMKYLHEMYNKQRKLIGFDDNVLVFHQRGFIAITPDSVTQRFKRYLRVLGMNDNLHLHSTRHTMATKLINNNVPIPIVQKIGGWSETATLLNVYAHSDTQKEKQAMELLKIT